MHDKRLILWIVVSFFINSSQILSAREPKIDKNPKLEESISKQVVDANKVDEQLKRLARLSPQEQEYLIGRSEVILTPQAYLALYDNAEDKKSFIEKILDARFTPEQRQSLINDLLVENATYAQLMTHVSQQDCMKIQDAANPFYFGALPLVDWLNTTYFNGFFRPTMTDVLINRDVYNEFDTLNQVGLWVEPFGFYTQFRQDADFLRFNQYTAGFSLGGSYTFFDRLILGFGGGYSYSGVEWQDLSESRATVNSFYFGPAVNYVFSKGYFGCILFGVANLYHIDRESNLFPEKTPPVSTSVDYKSWDVVARAEGGLSYSLGGQFYFSPQARVDYLHIFEQEAVEELDEEVQMTVDPLHQSFLCSKIGLKISREFYQPAFGFIIPSLLAGWINFTPLTLDSYHFHIGECENLEKKTDIKAWSQYYFGASFEMIRKKGVLIALDYTMSLGAASPLYGGYLRIELNW